VASRVNANVFCTANAPGRGRGFFFVHREFLIRFLHVQRRISDPFRGWIKSKNPPRPPRSGKRRRSQAAFKLTYLSDGLLNPARSLTTRRSTYQASYINPRPRGTVSHACAGLEGGRLLEANRMALALGPLPGLDQ